CRRHLLLLPLAPRQGADELVDLVVLRVVLRVAHLRDLLRGVRRRRHRTAARRRRRAGAYLRDRLPKRGVFRRVDLRRDLLLRLLSAVRDAALHTQVVDDRERRLREPCRRAGSLRRILRLPEPLIAGERRTPRGVERQRLAVDLPDFRVALISEERVYHAVDHHDAPVLTRREREVALPRRRVDRALQVVGDLPHVHVEVAIAQLRQLRRRRLERVGQPLAVVLVLAHERLVLRVVHRVGRPLEHLALGDLLRRLRDGLLRFVQLEEVALVPLPQLRELRLVELRQVAIRPRLSGAALTLRALRLALCTTGALSAGRRAPRGLLAATVTCGRRRRGRFLDLRRSRGRAAARLLGVLPQGLDRAVVELGRHRPLSGPRITKKRPP